MFNRRAAETFTRASELHFCELFLLAALPLLSARHHGLQEAGLFAHLNHSLTISQKKSQEGINSRLALVLKSGKVSLGYKQTLKSIRNGKGTYFSLRGVSSAFWDLLLVRIFSGKLSVRL